MTARSDDPGVSPGTSSAAAAGEIWGTWEELLLACAVRRHGTASWDSVAMEVQSRCPASAAARLSPTGCRLRFRLLHRRFAAGAENGGWRSSASCASPSSAAMSSDTTSRSGKAREEGKINSLDNNEKTPKCV